MFRLLLPGLTALVLCLPALAQDNPPIHTHDPVPERQAAAQAAKALPEPQIAFVQIEEDQKEPRLWHILVQFKDSRHRGGMLIVGTKPQFELEKGQEQTRFQPNTASCLLTAHSYQVTKKTVVHLCFQTKRGAVKYWESVVLMPK